jgi:hypothetical protein
MEKVDINKDEPKITDDIKIIDVIPPKPVNPNEAAVVESPLPPDPVPAEPEEMPSPEDRPGAKNAVVREADEMGLKIVDAERDGANLYLVVEGDHVEDVQGHMARKLAYDARFDYGFTNSGLDAVGGPEPINGGERYRQTWRLQRGLG